ncbi:MAG: DUF2281 domain-containing protein [Chitinispirillia bacterium]|nr:DUF2281 domain-containing protein [Chitinispirillia bacterium]MCL2268309.1 DUF2281 domain-containing protein [Chitinispirillia bacterium]
MTQISLYIEDTVANKLSDAARLMNCYISKYAASLVSERLAETPAAKKPRSAMRGCLKGKVWMSDDFNAPLSEMRE